MSPEISLLHRQLASHPVFSQLSSIANIRIFMTYHVFAVWDFMSLLKALQREITCVEVPWVESKYDPELVQLINEIVLSEESDVDQHGNPCSHFSLYIQAMKEIGADAKLVSKFIKTKNTDLLPKEIANIICYHLGLAQKGNVYEVASSFFWGREKLIPDMFESIVATLKQEKMRCPTLEYYLKRHIELDSEDHGPKALRCLNSLVKSASSCPEILIKTKDIVGFHSTSNTSDLEWKKTSKVQPSGFKIFSEI